MTITLPDEMRDDLERRAKAHGFASVNEFVLWLLEEDLSETGGQTPEELGLGSHRELEAKLLTSLDSGPLVPATPEFWDALRRQVREAADRDQAR